MNPGFPPQEQPVRPGHESQMRPEPIYRDPNYRAAGKLDGKVALITGADSGIGRAVAIAFALEGADIAAGYLNEHEDAAKTRKEVESCGRKCLLISGDVGDENFCQQMVAHTLEQYSRIDILINNAAEQHPVESIEEITGGQLERTFRTNLFSFFFLTKWALPHLGRGGCIINTASVTAYRGSPKLLDYSSTKGAIISFTRSLSLALGDRGIRVNAVAPGPIWTPLIPSTFPGEKVQRFGDDVPLGRAGQPFEVAPSYVFLASSDAAYISGQVIHPNGGEVVNT